jgi:hypothetical protein
MLIQLHELRGVEEKGDFLNWKDVECRGREVYLKVKSVWIPGFEAKIRTRHLPNTKQDCQSLGLDIYPAVRNIQFIKKTNLRTD